jgi:predicted phage terminase large subunit-like protein
VARREYFKYDIQGFAEYYLADYFTSELKQYHIEILLAENGIYEVPRGHGKSTALLALILHACLYGWKKYVVIASATATQAYGFSRRIKDELETNERINEDFGDLTGKKWTQSHFTCTNGFTCRAIGSGGSVRGIVEKNRRPDLIICDDLEDDEATQTPELREKLWKWVTTALFNVGVGKIVDRIIVGTPLHNDCVLRRLKKKHPERYNQWKAIAEDGALLWPEVYTQDILDEIKYEIGSLAFAQEYQMEPMDDQTKPFKPEWFRYFDDSETPTPDHWWRFMYVDPAIGQKKTSDWFVASICAISPMGEPLEVRVLEQFKAKLSVAGQLATIEQLTDKWQPMQVGIESNAYQDSLRQLSMERFAETRNWVSVVSVVSTTNKKVRIMKLSPRVETGRLKFRKGDPAQAELITHMTEYPSVTHDDFEDSLEGVVAMAERTGRMTS